MIQNLKFQSIICLRDDGHISYGVTIVRFSAAIHGNGCQSSSIRRDGKGAVVCKTHLDFAGRPLGRVHRIDSDLPGGWIHIGVNGESQQGADIPEIERARIIDAEWQAGAEEDKGQFLAEITVYANNRSGLLADITRTLTEKNIDIITLNTRTSKQGIATLSTSFNISGREELRVIIDKLRSVPSVIDIERTRG